jgi:hypothetical protein
LLWATIPPEETTIKNLSSAGNLSWRLPYPQIKRLHFSFVLSKGFATQISFLKWRIFFYFTPLFSL